MRVKVLYLAGSRVQAGCSQEAIELPEDATVGQAAALIGTAHPALAPLLDTVRWAVNHSFASSNTALHDGDELALLPPVAGGANRAELVRQPLDVQAVCRRAAADQHGATVLFVGTVRNHADNGREVAELTYEAYEPMAAKGLEALAEEICTAEPGVDLAISHRLGTLEVGAVSVVIAASAAHRQPAFDACRQALERLKSEVPIWKRESGPQGDSWVGWGGG